MQTSWNSFINFYKNFYISVIPSIYGMFLRFFFLFSFPPDIIPLPELSSDVICPDTIQGIMTDFLKQHRWTLISIAIIIPVGLYGKFYRGPADCWVNNSLGGFFYVIFWSLAAFLLFSRTPAWKIALVIFTATCSLEFLQLWHPAFLGAIRGNFMGRALIGNSFSGTDFIYYVVGGLAGWCWIKLLKRK